MPRPTGDIEILDHMGPAAEAFAHFDHWLMNHLRGGGFYNPLSATDLAIPAFREELRDRAERRRVASTDFRRSIYERGQYVVPHSVTDFTGRVRESSPNWYRGNPAQTHRYTFTSMPCIFQHSTSLNVTNVKFYDEKFFCFQRKISEKL